jgi:hypothetical protein
MDAVIPVWAVNEVQLVRDQDCDLVEVRDMREALAPRPPLVLCKAATELQPPSYFWPQGRPRLLFDISPMI